MLDALSAFFPKLVTFCAIVAAFIPPQSTGFLGASYKVINALAFNFNHARNAQ